MVSSHLTKYGPRGVPSGLVEAQKRGQGRTPWRPHSRMTRDWPRSTARRLPKELRAMRKLRPLTALPVPKTFWRKRLAAICFAAARSSFGTVGKIFIYLAGWCFSTPAWRRGCVCPFGGGGFVGTCLLRSMRCWRGCIAPSRR